MPWNGLCIRWENSSVYFLTPSLRWECVVSILSILVGCQGWGWRGSFYVFIFLHVSEHSEHVFLLAFIGKIDYFYRCPPTHLRKILCNVVQPPKIKDFIILDSTLPVRRGGGFISYKIRRNQIISHDEPVSSSKSHFWQNHHVVIFCLLVTGRQVDRWSINRKFNSDLSSIL